MRAPKLLRLAATAAALLFGVVLLNACSVQINTGSTPTPSAKPTPTPSPTPRPVSVVITDHLDSSGCQTSGSVTVLVDGQNVGTMRVDNQSISTDRLTVMLAPAEHKYSLKGSAFFLSNGQAFSLNVSGQGQALVNPGANSWSLGVDTSRVSPNSCPAQGSTWPLVIETG